MNQLNRIFYSAIVCSVAVVFDVAFFVAAASALEVNVDAGKFDRLNTPVCVPIDKDRLSAPRHISVVCPDGRVSAAQITKPSLLTNDTTKAELHFVISSLRAGEEEVFDATVPMRAESRAAFRWEEKPGEYIDLFYGDRPVLRYMCKPLDESSPEAREQTFKPFHHVFDPASGKQLLTKGPGGLFTHHRGMFFGFNKVTHGDNQQCDVWHCRDGAYQQHEKVISTEAGPVLARQRLAISWHGKKGVLFANEERELTVYNVPGGTLIDFASRVTPVEGKVKFDGDPQHAGFHFRAAQEVAMQTKAGQDEAVKSKRAEKGSMKPNPQTYYLRADGKGAIGETRNWDHKAKQQDPKTVNLPWNALSMVVGGERYTVEYMDSPNNPKEARYSERDYGRFGSYFVAEATPETPLEVRYRVWIQPGEMTVEQAAAKDADFDEPPKASVVAEGAAHAKRTADNTPPEGFTALFNGKDLTGWKGLVANPKERAKMSPEKLADAQAKADQIMRDHWKVVDGVLVFDGDKTGQSLCSAKDYGDFEMLVDWKIEAGGDSGIYVRGTPQVQIWDPQHERDHKHGSDKGSGALWNNQQHERFPKLAADKPTGQWNTFRIRMVGEKVSVWLNGQLVTDNVPMENYWERDKPIYPTGAIELQSHNSPLSFKNIYVKELLKD
jgi:hypothetical protein